MPHHASALVQIWCGWMCEVWVRWMRRVSEPERSSQSQNAVTNYFSNKQLPSSELAEQSAALHFPNIQAESMRPATHCRNHWDPQDHTATGCNHRDPQDDTATGCNQRDPQDDTATGCDHRDSHCNHPDPQCDTASSSGHHRDLQEHTATDLSQIWCWLMARNYSLYGIRDSDPMLL